MEKQNFIVQGVFSILPDKDNDFKPLRLQEHHVILYRDFLLEKKQKVNTVAAKLNAIRKFYHIAQKFHIIQDNPAG